MRIVIIGAGISGLTSALMAKEAGHDVTVLTKGFGGLQLGQATIDIFDSPTPLTSVSEAPASHPYHEIGVDNVRAGVAAFARYIPLEGSLEKSVKMPTALGAVRTTSLYPPSMAAGILEAGKKYVLVGMSGMKDFYPQLAAENLRTQGYDVRAHMLGVRAPQGETALAMSRLFDQEAHAHRLAQKLKEIAGEGEIIGIPAVLRSEVFARVQNECGHPLFQIPTQPPSIIGLEMNELLRAACASQRVRMFLNSQAVGLVQSGKKITGVRVQVAGAVKTIDADAVIYAGGGLDSGAIELDSYRELHDILGLPVERPEGELLHADYWGAPQPLWACGLRVDAHMRPCENGEPVATNLYAVGGMLAGAQRQHEKSGEGIALGSAAGAVAQLGKDEA